MVSGLRRLDAGGRLDADMVSEPPLQLCGGVEVISTELLEQQPVLGRDQACITDPPAEPIDLVGGERPGHSGAAYRRLLASGQMRLTRG